MTCITVYDGSRTIGGSKIYLEERGKGLFLDFGMNFAKYGQYFQQFLNARRTRGIHDFFTLNLIPKLNIYRRDLIPGDISVSQYPKLDIEGVLLSHAHLDHFGNIGLLQRDVPVVASSISIALMKAIRDSSLANFGYEAVYFGEREQDEEDERILSSNGGNYIGRPFFSAQTPSRRLTQFMEICTSAKTKSIDSMGLHPLGNLRSHFEISPYTVDHSILGATAYVIEGDTTVAYTGDFRLHGRQGDRSKAFINNARDASVLVIEGTRVTREEDSIISEETVHENCLGSIEPARDLVVVNFSNRNIERLETFKAIADKVGRQLVISAKTAYLLKALECADGKNHSRDILVLKQLKNSSRVWKDCLSEPFSGDKAQVAADLFSEPFLRVDPLDIKKAPGRYILCMSFYELSNLLDIKPDHGLYIHSSSEAFTEEMEFDFVRFYHWLDLFNFTVDGMSLETENGKEYPVFTEGYHSSGHVNKAGLRWAVDTIDPDLIIPVHTEQPEWFKAEFDNVLVPEEGKRYTV